MDRGDAIALLHHSTPLRARVNGDANTDYSYGQNTSELFHSAYARGQDIARELTPGISGYDAGYFMDLSGEEFRDLASSEGPASKPVLLGIRNAWCVALNSVREEFDALFPENGDALRPVLQNGDVGEPQLDSYRLNAAREDALTYTYDIVKPVGDLLRYGRRLDEDLKDPREG